MNKSFLISLVIASAALNMHAQTEVAPYAPGVTPEGITYYLPRTELHFIVTATSTTYQPGDFRQYAARYLRLNDVPREPSVTWKIDDIKMYAVGVPDTSKIFTVKLNPKTSAPLVGLTSSGILLSINADAPAPEKRPALPGPVVKSSKLNARDYMGQEILAAGSVAKMAELTANEIYDIRESRTLLAKGEADYMPKDGEQLRIMLANLDRQDKALTQLFTGTTTKDTTEYVLTVCPQPGMQKQVLFRLSQKLGLVDNDDLSGEPYYISVTDEQSLPAAAPETEGGKKKKEKEDGIYVNIPGKITVNIYKGATLLDSFETSAAQYGYTELLSGELFNKRYTTHLTLNPATGAIDKLDAEQPE